MKRKLLNDEQLERCRQLKVTIAFGRGMPDGLGKFRNGYWVARIVGDGLIKTKGDRKSLFVFDNLENAFDAVLDPVKYECEWDNPKER